MVVLSLAHECSFLFYVLRLLQSLWMSLGIPPFFLLSSAANSQPKRYIHIRTSVRSCGHIWQAGSTRFKASRICF